MPRLSRLASSLLVLALWMFAAPSAHAAIAADSTGVSPVQFSIDPPAPCVNDTITLVGELCGKCAVFEDAREMNGQFVFVVRQSMRPCPTGPCPQDVRRIKLGAVQIGHHFLDVATWVIHPGPADLPETTFFRQYVELDPLPNCHHTSLVPTLDRVLIDRGAPCEGCPFTVCGQHDSFPVHLSGMLPSGCWSLNHLEPGPSLEGRSYVNAVFNVDTCGGVFCDSAGGRWSGDVLLPAPMLDHGDLRVSFVMVGCPDSAVVRSIDLGTVATFVVSACDSGLAACVEPYLFPANDATCQTTIRPGGEAFVDLALRSGVRVAGLQGILSVQAPLRVTRVEAIGLAGALTALAHPTDSGADWAMFGLNGQQIPPVARGAVLRVFVAAPDSVALPHRLGVGSTITVVSDSLGGRVPICDIRYENFMMPTAWVCSGQGCDFNGDREEDVRDLVTMVGCIQHPGSCPDVLSGSDCNGDGAFDLDDVLCCARHILHGAGVDTIAPRPGDGLAVSFGDPERTASGVEVPVTLSGYEAVGGMKLLLKFPADRFEFDAATFEGSANGWLSVHETRGPGEVALALINLGSADLALPWRLALRLKPGAEPSGAISVESAEFTSMTGGPLTATVAGTTSPPLGSATTARIGLSLARPNPFGQSTRFAVTLARAGTVELSVHDIAGRKVATLHQGRLEAGTREFTWGGTADGGPRSPDGVYFVRLRVDGRVWSQRVALLRGQ